MTGGTRSAVGAILLSLGCAQAWGESKVPVQARSMGATVSDGGKRAGVASGDDRVVKTEAEWRRELTPEQFEVMREKGTERPFTGQYYASHEPAHYVCAACGAELFSSEQKFDSGTGWPSFWAPVDGGRVATETDKSFLMTRTEVHCSRCGGHLGHVFDDGPPPTGLRYCINSVALKALPPK
jgi:peptide-methionine (R)-S-oxide reductase